MSDNTITSTLCDLLMFCICVLNLAHTVASVSPTSNQAMLVIKNLCLASLQTNVGISLQLVKFINTFVPTVTQSESVHVDV